MRKVDRKKALLICICVSLFVLTQACQTQSIQTEITAVPYDLDVVLDAKTRIETEMNKLFKKCVYKTPKGDRESRFTRFAGRLVEFNNLSWESFVEKRDHREANLNNIEFWGFVKIVPEKKVSAAAEQQVSYREYDEAGKGWPEDFQTFNLSQASIVNIARKQGQWKPSESSYSAPVSSCEALSQGHPVASDIVPRVSSQTEAMALSDNENSTAYKMKDPKEWTFQDAEAWFKDYVKKRSTYYEGSYYFLNTQQYIEDYAQRVCNVTGKVITEVVGFSYEATAGNTPPPSTAEKLNDDYIEWEIVFEIKSAAHRHIYMPENCDCDCNYGISEYREKLEMRRDHTKSRGRRAFDLDDKLDSDPSQFSQDNAFIPAPYLNARGYGHNAAYLNERYLVPDQRAPTISEIKSALKLPPLKRLDRLSGEPTKPSDK